MPFNGFLSPSSDIQYATRILRHLLFYYIILYNIFVNFFIIFDFLKLLLSPGRHYKRDQNPKQCADDDFKRSMPDQFFQILFYIYRLMFR